MTEQRTTLPLINRVDQHPRGARIYTKHRHDFRSGDVVYINAGNYKNVLDEETLSDAMSILEDELRDIGSLVLEVDSEQRWLVIEQPYVSDKHFNDQEQEGYSMLDNLSGLLSQTQSTAVDQNLDPVLENVSVYNDKDRGFIDEVYVTLSYFEAPEVNSSEWVNGLAGKDRGGYDDSGSLELVHRKPHISADKYEDDAYNTLLEYYSNNYDSVLKEPTDPNRPFTWFSGNVDWISGIHCNGFWTGDNRWNQPSVTAEIENFVDPETDEIDERPWEGFAYQYSRFKRGYWDTKDIDNGLDGYWQGGQWEKGIWDGNSWLRGLMLGGIVLGGTWEDGLADSQNNYLQFPYPVSVSGLGYLEFDPNLKDITKLTWRGGEAYELIWNWGTWEKGEWYGAGRVRWSIDASWNSGTGRHELTLSLSDDRTRDRWAWRVDSDDLISLTNSPEPELNRIARTIVSGTNYEYEIETLVTSKEVEDFSSSAAITASIWNVGSFLSGTWNSGTKNDSSLYIRKQVGANPSIATETEWQCYTSYANPVNYTRDLVNYSYGYPFYLCQGNFDDTLPDNNFKTVAWNLSTGEDLTRPDAVSTDYGLVDSLDSTLESASNTISMSNLPGSYDPYKYSPQQVDYTDWQNVEWLDGLWLGGIWRDGTWEDGEWYAGTWLEGSWQNGSWRSGYWSNGVWQSGEWTSQLNWDVQKLVEHDDIRDNTSLDPWDNQFKPTYSVWRSGTHEDGSWRNGLWISGSWLDGIFRDGGIVDIDWRGGSYDPIVIYGDELTEPLLTAYNNEFDFNEFNAAIPYYVNNSLAYQPGYRLYMPYHKTVTDIDAVSYDSTEPLIEDQFYKLETSVNFRNYENQWYNSRTVSPGVDANEISSDIISYELFEESWEVDQTNTDPLWIRAVNSDLFQDLRMEPNGVVVWHHVLYDVDWYGGDFQLRWREKPDQFETIFGKQRKLDMSLACFFLFGRWFNGDFHQGSFGDGRYFSLHDTTGDVLQKGDYDYSTWLDGRFFDGYWYGGHAQGGQFISGNFIRGYFSSDQNKINIQGGSWGKVLEADILAWDVDPVLRPDYTKNPYYLTDLKWDRLDPTDGSSAYALQARSMYIDQQDYSNDASGFKMRFLENPEFDRVVALSNTFYEVSHSATGDIESNNLVLVVDSTNVINNDPSELSESELWVRVKGVSYLQEDPDVIINGFKKVLNYTTTSTQTRIEVDCEITSDQLELIDFTRCTVSESEIKKTYGKRVNSYDIHNSADNSEIKYSLDNEVAFIRLSDWIDVSEGPLRQPRYMMSQLESSLGPVLDSVEWRNTHRLWADRNYDSKQLTEGIAPSTYTHYTLDLNSESRYYNLIIERTDKPIKIENSDVSNTYLKGIRSKDKRDLVSKTILQDSYIQDTLNELSTLTRSIANDSTIRSCRLDSCTLYGYDNKGVMDLDRYTLIEGNTTDDTSDNKNIFAPDRINLWSVTKNIELQERVSGTKANWDTLSDEYPLIGIYWDGVDDSGLDTKDEILNLRGFYDEQISNVGPTSVSPSGIAHDRVIGTSQSRPLTLCAQQQDSTVDVDVYGGLIAWAGPYRKGSWYDPAQSDNWMTHDVTPSPSPLAPLSPAFSNLLNSTQSNFTNVDQSTAPGQYVIDNTKLSISVFTDYDEVQNETIKSVAPYASISSKAMNGVRMGSGRLSRSQFNRGEISGGTLIESLIYSEIDGYCSKSGDTYDELDSSGSGISVRNTSDECHRTFSVHCQFDITSESNSVIDTSLTLPSYDTVDGATNLVSLIASRESVPYRLSTETLYRVTISSDSTTLDGLLVTSDTLQQELQLSWNSDLKRKLEKLEGEVQVTFEPVFNLSGSTVSETPFDDSPYNSQSAINTLPHLEKELPGLEQEGFRWYGLDINSDQRANYQTRLFYPNNTIIRSGSMINCMWSGGLWKGGSALIDHTSRIEPSLMPFLPMWLDGIQSGGSLTGSLETSSITSEEIPSMIWVMGFNFGGSVTRARWMRGYFDGGTWNSGEWHSRDYQSNVLFYQREDSFGADDNENARINGRRFYKSLSYWISGLWRSIGLDGNFDNSASSWFDGIWLGTSGITDYEGFNPIRKSVAEATWNGPYTRYQIDDQRSVILNGSSSNWLGGTWFRGLWGGGNFYGGVWKAVPYLELTSDNEDIVFTPLDTGPSGTSDPDRYNPQEANLPDLKSETNGKYLETIIGNKAGLSVDNNAYSIEYVISYVDGSGSTQEHNRTFVSEFVDYNPVSGTFNLEPDLEFYPTSTQLAVGRAVGSIFSDPDPSPSITNRAEFRINRVDTDLSFGLDPSTNSGLADNTSSGSEFVAEPSNLAPINILTWYMFDGSDYYAVVCCAEPTLSTPVGYVRKVKLEGYVELSIDNQAQVFFKALPAGVTPSNAVGSRAPDLTSGNTIQQDFLANSGSYSGGSTGSPFSTAFSASLGAGGSNYIWLNTNPFENIISGGGLPQYDCVSGTDRSWVESVGLDYVEYNGANIDTTAYDEIILDDISTEPPEISNGSVSSNPAEYQPYGASVFNGFNSDVSVAGYSWMSLKLRINSKLFRVGREDVIDTPISYDYNTFGNIIGNMEFNDVWPGQNSTINITGSLADNSIYHYNSGSSVFNSFNEPVLAQVSVEDHQGVPVTTPFNVNTTVLSIFDASNDEVELDYIPSFSFGLDTTVSPNASYFSDNDPTTYEYPGSFQGVPGTTLWDEIDQSDSIQDWDYNEQQQRDPIYNVYQLEHGAYPSIFYQGAFLNSVWEGGSFAPEHRYEFYRDGWDTVPELIPGVLDKRDETKDHKALFGSYVPQERDWLGLSTGFDYEQPLISDNVLFTQDDSNFTMESLGEVSEFRYYAPRSTSYVDYMAKRLFSATIYDPEDSDVITESYTDEGSFINRPMTSYWKRGVFNQGIFSWSVWDNKKLIQEAGEIVENGEDRYVEIYPSVAKLGRKVFYNNFGFSYPRIESDGLPVLDSLLVYQERDSSDTIIDPQSEQALLNPSVFLGGMQLWSTWYGGQSVAFRHVFNRSRWVTGTWCPSEEVADIDFITKQYEELFGNPNKYIKQSLDVTPKLESYEFVTPAGGYTKAIELSGRQLDTSIEEEDDSVTTTDIFTNYEFIYIRESSVASNSPIRDIQIGDFIRIQTSGEFTDSSSTPAVIDSVQQVVDYSIVVDYFGPGDDAIFIEVVDTLFSISDFSGDYNLVPQEDTVISLLTIGQLFVALGRQIYTLGETGYQWQSSADNPIAVPNRYNLRYIDETGADIDLAEFLQGTKQANKLRLDFNSEMDLNFYLKYWWDEQGYDASSIHIATSNGVDGLRMRVVDHDSSSVFTRDTLERLEQNQFHQSVWQSGYWKNGEMTQSVINSGFNPTEEPVLGLQTGNDDDTEIRILGNTIANGTEILYKTDIGEQGFVRENVGYRDLADELTLGDNGLYEAWSHVHAELCDANRLFPEYNQLFLHDGYPTRFLRKSRFAGNVDNFATVWEKGLFEGGFWNGGIWRDGEFYHRTVIGDGVNRDFFNNVIASNQVNSQISVWTRGLWLGGIFSSRQFTNPYISVDTTDGDQRYLRCWFMSIDLPTEELDTDVFTPSNATGVTLAWMRSKIEYTLDQKPSVQENGEMYLRDLNQLGSWFTRLNRLESSLDLEQGVDKPDTDRNSHLSNDSYDNGHLRGSDFAPSNYKNYYVANILLHYGVTETPIDSSDDDLLWISNEYYDNNPHHLSHYRWSEFNGTFLSGVLFDPFKKHTYVADDGGVPQMTPLLSSYAEWGKQRSRISPFDNEKDLRPLGNQLYNLRVGKNASGQDVSYTIGQQDPFNTTQWEQTAFFYPLFMTTRHWRRTGIDHVNRNSVVFTEQETQESQQAKLENGQVVQVLDTNSSIISDLLQTSGIPLSTPLYTLQALEEEDVNISNARLRFESNSLKNTVLDTNLVAFDMLRETSYRSNYHILDTYDNVFNYTNVGSAINNEDANYSKDVSLQQDGSMWSKLTDRDAHNMHKADPEDRWFPLYGGGSRTYVKARSNDFGNNWQQIESVTPGGFFIDFSQMIIDDFDNPTSGGPPYVSFEFELPNGNQYYVWFRRDDEVAPSQPSNVTVIESDVSSYNNSSSIQNQLQADLSSSLSTEINDGLLSITSSVHKRRIYVNYLTIGDYAKPTLESLGTGRAYIKDYRDLEDFVIKDHRCRSFGNMFIDFNGRVYFERNEVYEWETYISDGPEIEIEEIVGDEYLTYALVKDTNTLDQDMIVKFPLQLNNASATLVPGSGIITTLICDNPGSEIINKLSRLEGQSVSVTSEFNDIYSEVRIDDTNYNQLTILSVTPSSGLTIELEGSATSILTQIPLPDRVWLLGPLVSADTSRDLSRRGSNSITRKIYVSQNGLDWNVIAAYTEGAESVLGSLLDGIGMGSSAVDNDSMPTCMTLRDGVLYVGSSVGKIYRYDPSVSNSWVELAINNRDANMYIRGIEVYKDQIYAIAYNGYTDWEQYWKTTTISGEDIFVDQRKSPYNIYVMRLDETLNRWITVDNFKDINIDFDYSTNLLLKEQVNWPETILDGSLGGSSNDFNVLNRNDVDSGLDDPVTANLMKANRNSKIRLQVEGDQILAYQIESGEVSFSGALQFVSRSVSISNIRKLDTESNTWKKLNNDLGLVIKDITGDKIYTSLDQVYDLDSDRLDLLSGNVINNTTTDLSPIDSITMLTGSKFIRGIFNNYSLLSGYNGNLNIARYNRANFPLNDSLNLDVDDKDIYTLTPLSAVLSNYPLYFPSVGGEFTSDPGFQSQIKRFGQTADISEQLHTLGGTGFVGYYMESVNNLYKKNDGLATDPVDIDTLSEVWQHRDIFLWDSVKVLNILDWDDEWSAAIDVEEIDITDKIFYGSGKSDRNWIFRGYDLSSGQLTSSYDVTETSPSGIPSRYNKAINYKNSDVAWVGKSGALIISKPSKVFSCSINNPTQISSPSHQYIHKNDLVNVIGRFDNTGPVSYYDNRLETLNNFKIGDSAFSAMAMRRSTNDNVAATNIDLHQDVLDGYNVVVPKDVIPLSDSVLVTSSSIENRQILWDSWTYEEQYTALRPRWIEIPDSYFVEDRLDFYDVVWDKTSADEIEYFHDRIGGGMPTDTARPLSGSPSAAELQQTGTENLAYDNRRFMYVACSDGYVLKVDTEFTTGTSDDFMFYKVDSESRDLYAIYFHHDDDDNEYLIVAGERGAAFYLPKESYNASPVEGWDITNGWVPIVGLSSGDIYDIDGHRGDDFELSGDPPSFSAKNSDLDSKDQYYTDTIPLDVGSVTYFVQNRLGNKLAFATSSGDIIDLSLQRVLGQDQVNVLRYVNVSNRFPVKSLDVNQSHFRVNFYIGSDRNTSRAELIDKFGGLATTTKFDYMFSRRYYFDYMDYDDLATTLTKSLQQIPQDLSSILGQNAASDLILQISGADATLQEGRQSPRGDLINSLSKYELEDQPVRFVGYEEAVTEFEDDFVELFSQNPPLQNGMVERISWSTQDEYFYSTNPFEFKLDDIYNYGTWIKGVTYYGMFTHAIQVLPVLSNVRFKPVKLGERWNGFFTDTPPRRTQQSDYYYSFGDSMSFVYNDARVNPELSPELIQASLEQQTRLVQILQSGHNRIPVLYYLDRLEE